MALSKEEILKIRQKYNLSDIDVTGQTKSANTRIAELRNNSLQQKQINDYSESPQHQSFLQKFGDIAGKTLGIGSTLTGAKAGVELAAPVVQLASMPFVGEKGRERILLGPAIGEVTQKAEQEGIGSAVKDIAGKSLEVGSMMAPFSKGSEVIYKLAKFPTISRYLGYGVTGGIYGGTISASQALQENKKLIPEIIKGVGTGALLGIAIPAIIEGTVRAVKNVTSLYSGVPKGALENAFDNPEKVQQAVHKYASSPEKKKEILDNANDALNKIKQQRSANYEAALKQIPATLPDEGVKTMLNDSLGKYSVKTLVKSEQNTIKELNTLINSWDDFSAIGVNELKQAIRNRKLITSSDYLKKILGGMETDLVKYIEKTSPEIAQMNSVYREASQFIDSLQSEIFGTTSTMKDSTKINRLLSIFSNNSGVRKELIEQLGEKAGVDLINEITGSVMTEWLPTGWVQRMILGGGTVAGAWQGFSPATLAAGAAAASPRIVGKATRVLGQMNRLAPSAGKVGLPYSIRTINEINNSRK